MGVLRAEGIEVQEFATEAHRPNVVARLKGTGAKRPLLLMAHTDTVNVFPERWTFPPFSATVDGGYVYGRGAVDDKDNVATSLMVMLMLKRLNVPLDRDVIFLAESGEEGSTQVGIQFMTNEHLDAINAEYCIAEGGGVVRTGGVVRYASVQTLEKRPYAIELVARGPAGLKLVELEDQEPAVGPGAKGEGAVGRHEEVLHRAGVPGHLEVGRQPRRLEEPQRRQRRRRRLVPAAAAAAPR